MIAGGDRDSTNKSRLFEVTQEAIVKLDDLPFELAEGRCVGNIGFNNDVVFCAGFDDQKHCHIRSEDGKFKKTRPTSDNHYLGGLARYKSSVILFSGQEDGRGTTEILEE